MMTLMEWFNYLQIQHLLATKPQVYEPWSTIALTVLRALGHFIALTVFSEVEEALIKAVCDKCVKLQQFTYLCTLQL